MGKYNSKGFTAVEALIIIVVVAVIGLGGWYVWQKNKDKNEDASKKQTSQQNTDNKDDAATQPEAQDETAAWTLATTQANGFSMRVPDGWTVTNYPNNYIGSTETTFKSGTKAIVNTSSTEYAGHTLRFKASIEAHSPAGLGPQWQSPQDGLQESAQDFAIGSINGKRYKAVFSADIKQTIYQYVFDLGNNKKLDIVYTVDQTRSDKDDVDTVEKAIKTIKVVK